MDLHFIKTALVTLFVAVDPPGLIPIFLTLTGTMSNAQRNITARRAVVIAFVILTIAALGGQAVLDALGISMPAFRIAGGLLLFYIAFEMVFERREERKADKAEEAMNEDHIHDIAAFPLAVPLIAGPGCITATILQSAAAGTSFMGQASLIIVLVIILGGTFLMFRLSLQLDRLISKTARNVIIRLLGVILAAMAAQIIGDGVVAFR